MWTDNEYYSKKKIPSGASGSQCSGPASTILVLPAVYLLLL